MILQSADDYFNFLNIKSLKQLIEWLMQLEYLSPKRICPACKLFCKLVAYKKNFDKNGWRCMNTGYSRKKKYYSICINSFFE